MREPGTCLRSGTLFTWSEEEVDVSIYTSRRLTWMKLEALDEVGVYLNADGQMRMRMRMMEKRRRRRRGGRGKGREDKRGEVD